MVAGLLGESARDSHYTSLVHLSLFLPFPLAAPSVQQSRFGFPTAFTLEFPELLVLI